MLDQKGPLMIAANHPNSFLDAIIVGSVFKVPIYSLARGDAFTGEIVSKILRSFNMLPVYRISEGKENLEHNYATFDSCQQLFDQNKIVLIFSEGRCINEWHLRPLKKGTARIALAAWKDNKPLRILPLGINYNSFRSFGKNIILNFGTIITQKDIQEDLASGKALIEFNQKLQLQLENLVYEIHKNDHKKWNPLFYIQPSLLKKVLLFIPSVTGFILNAPLYLSIHLVIKKRAKDHYDSIMMALLFLLYPLYVLLATMVTFFIIKSYAALILLLVIPLTALSFLHFKIIGLKRQPAFNKKTVHLK